MKVVVVDYGSGNLHSAHKAFERAALDAGIAADIEVSADTAKVRAADRIVLPGVGAFADCRKGLRSVAGLPEALRASVLERGRPFLGVCVGMQLLATRGLEHGDTPGLNWIEGVVDALAPADPALPIPHMGWNTLEPEGELHPVLEGLPLGPNGLHAYFVHSYASRPKASDALVASADYGGKFAAMIGRDNIVGVQFHPEKSQELGLRLIANFLKWKP